MKTVLYTGLDPSHCKVEGRIIHCPLIQIVPRSPKESDIQQAMRAMEHYTHILISSKSALKILIEYLPHFGLSMASLQKKLFISVGEVSATHIRKLDLTVQFIAKEESSEGLINEILGDLPATTYLFWPHSALSQPLISNFLQKQPYCHQECLLYDTLPKAPASPIDLTTIDEIIFTSPSTVEAFLRFFGPFPQDKILTPIGATTAKFLPRK